MSKFQDLDSLVQIFNFEKKKDLSRYCKVARIFKSDFAFFVLACEAGVFPWHHRIYYRDFVPEHLLPTKEEKVALAVNGAGPLKGKAVKMVHKIQQLFEERRYLVGHIFFTQTLAHWHFFYFDQRDLSDRINHWERGTHVHLINHLWPNHDAQTLWSKFTSGNVKLSGAMHLKFIENDRDVVKEKWTHHRDT